MPEPVSLMRGLSAIHGFVLAAMGMLVIFIPYMMLPSSFLNPPPDMPQLTVSSLVARFWLIRLVQLIAVETPAIIGLLVCWVGIQAGVMGDYPIFWLNLCSAIGFSLYVWTMFPSEESGMAWFRRLPLS